MAQAPNAGKLISNIMTTLRGGISFGKEDKTTPLALGSSDILTGDARRRMIQQAHPVITARSTTSNASSLMTAVTTSLNKVGQERLEYRKILQLMPDIAKAARLMVASILSPNDLARNEIAVTFDRDDLPDDTKAELQKIATKFFQQKLNLKKALFSWIYQFGYETGSAVFAVIPMTSFEKIVDDSFIGTESIVKNVIPEVSQSLFNFGDESHTMLNSEIAGLESLADRCVRSDPVFTDKTVPAGLSKDMVKLMLATEALSLTDNPSILQVKKEQKKRRTTKTGEAIANRYKVPVAQSVVSMSADVEGAPTDNPILIRLPPESVTVIHTPGDPSDHQGYLVLLDQSGNPITALIQEQDAQQLHQPGLQSVVTQAYNAHGLGGTTGTTMGSHSHREMTERLYSQVIGEHLRKRLAKAGFDHTDMGNTDAIFRCMFSRFMQQKQTRVLFLPKELVTYMAFELDEYGYGVSRLAGIKFNIGMKMAIQVSRTLAALKAAMDKRRIEMKFPENMIEQPEQMINQVIQQFIRKNSFSFSYDPNVIQSQIVSKSLSIQGVGIPGMEDFSLSNEQDSRSQPLDFDPNALQYQDDAIMNGMRIPASTMNSLNENEYARSVVTTNLFFSMDVSVDQDTTIHHGSDLLRKYASYSKELQDKLQAALPNSANSGEEGSHTDLSLAALIQSMTISLPTPNVAPSKTQFEVLETMITSIQNTFAALLPDEYAGGNPELSSTIALLRAKLTSTAISEYLSGTGMTGISAPTGDFAAHLGDIGKMTEALINLKDMILSKTSLGKSADALDGSQPYP